MVPETYFQVSEELRLFIYSIIMGIPIGIIYDFFRALRSVFIHKSVLVFIEDCIFFAVYALMLMCFAVVYARSEVRFYFAVGNLIGFAIYFFTIGKIVLGAIRKIVFFFQKIFGKAKKVIQNSAQKALGKIVESAEIVRIGKEKNANILQCDEQVLYNKHSSHHWTDKNVKKRFKKKAERNSGESKRKKKS